jgi:hypothetical protein
MNDQRKDSRGSASQDGTGDTTQGQESGENQQSAQQQEPSQQSTSSSALQTQERNFFQNVDVLTRWLKGFLWDPDLLGKREFTKEELQAALHSGCSLITDILDMELTAVVDTAADRFHNIEIKIEDMYQSREMVW